MLNLNLNKKDLRTPAAREGVDYKAIFSDSFISKVPNTNAYTFNLNSVEEISTVCGDLINDKNIIFTFNAEGTSVSGEFISIMSKINCSNLASDGQEIIFPGSLCTIQTFDAREANIQDTNIDYGNIYLLPGLAPGGWSLTSIELKFEYGESKVITLDNDYIQYNLICVQ